MKNLRLFKNNEELSNTKDSLISPAVAYVEEGQSVYYYPEGVINISVPKNLTITIGGKQYGEGVHQVKYNENLTISKDIAYNGTNATELIFALMNKSTKEMGKIETKEAIEYAAANLDGKDLADLTEDEQNAMYNILGYVIYIINGLYYVVGVASPTMQIKQDLTFENLPAYYDTIVIDYGA